MIEQGGPPVVDYLATSARPAWGELPEAVREAVAVALGTEIAEAGPSVRSGFTGGFAAPLKLADGREVFVKASDDSLHSYRAYQREAEIVPQLPPAIHVPPIIATAHALVAASPSAAHVRTEEPASPATTPPTEEAAQRWFAVVSERIVARMPGQPWTPQDFAVVTANCEVVAEALTPSPLPGLRAFTREVAATSFPSKLPDEILAGVRPLPPGFQPWLGARIPDLQDLVDLYPEALRGDSAVHGDLRPDNLLLDAAGQCWTVDWNWLSLGPKWFDWVGLLPIAHRDGIDTAAALKTCSLTADVPAEYVDCLAAVIAVYMLDNLDAPPPDGCTPELRRHQRLYAWAFLDWLAVRRGWATN